MIEKSSFNPKFPIIFNKSCLTYRMFHNANLLMINAAIAKAVKVAFATCRVITMNGVGDFIEIETHEHRAEAKAVVSVEMANENPSHCWRCNLCKNKLPLRTFSRIKKEPFIIPTQKIGAMIAKAGGLLTGATENCQIAYAHFVFTRR